MRAETQRKRNYNLPYTSVAERQSMNNLDNTRHLFSEVGTFKNYSKRLSKHRRPSLHELRNFVIRKKREDEASLRNYLKFKEEKGILRILEWTSQSPDLNLIELFVGGNEPTN